MKCLDGLCRVSTTLSVNHSYFSWLLGKKKEYVLDARIKGGQRNMIMSGEYDKVFPMNIYPEYLIKAILCGDIDKMEALGIYEVSPEDLLWQNLWIPQVGITADSQ